MDKINSYIDLILIDQYAHQSKYDLEACALSTEEQQNFLDLLFLYDPILKEMALDRMQELLNYRLERRELQDNYDKGLKIIHDPVNGEVTWIKRGAA